LHYNQIRRFAWGTMKSLAWYTQCNCSVLILITYNFWGWSAERKTQPVGWMQNNDSVACLWSGLAALYSTLALALSQSICDFWGLCGVINISLSRCWCLIMQRSIFPTSIDKPRLALSVFAKHYLYACIHTHAWSIYTARFNIEVIRSTLN
jgi:hypothetical protein